MKLSWWMMADACRRKRILALRMQREGRKEQLASGRRQVCISPGNPPLSQTHLSADIQRKYKVLIKRHDQTVGLIGAKKTGGDAATGDLIVFFDCHVGSLQAVARSFFGWSNSLFFWVVCASSSDFRCFASKLLSRTGIKTSYILSVRITDAW